MVVRYRIGTEALVWDRVVEATRVAMCGRDDWLVLWVQLGRVARVDRSVSHGRHRWTPHREGPVSARPDGSHAQLARRWCDCADSSRRTVWPEVCLGLDELPA